MKKDLLILLAILFLNFLISAQNLIPNGDFEEYSECPVIQNQVDRLDGWFSPALGSPEFLHECAPIGSVTSVPYSFLGYQPAQSGKGFVGLILYRNSGLTIREYVSIALLSPLKEEICYTFKMYINLSNGSRFAIDQIGAYFSDTMIVDFPDLFIPDVLPQIENPNGNILSDTMNWTLLQGTFQAKGTEQYLIIGNFNTDENTQDLLVNQNTLYDHGYYHIDNVSLVKIDCEEFLIPDQDITIYPNPVSSQLNIKIKNQTFPSVMNMQIFSSTGQFIGATNIEGKDIYSWDINLLPEGIYFLEISLLGKRYIRKVVKVNN